LSESVVSHEDGFTDVVSISPEVTEVHALLPRRP
jgi:hypothetical protein